MTIKISSWQMLKPGEPFKLLETSVSEPLNNEIIVKISGCGVCHTDLSFYYYGVKTKGSLPLTLGHEISGIVVAAGVDAKKWLNKAVIIPAVISCGKCKLCKNGLGNICFFQKMPGNDINGGFSSHIVVPSEHVCHVPTDTNFKPIGESNISLEELSVVADALTTPYQAIIDSKLSSKDTAIFVGVGGVGGFGAQIAKSFGAYVIAIDIDDDKLKAISPYVNETINSSRISFKDLRKKVYNFVKNEGKRLTEWKIFETSGSGAGQSLAFGLLTFGSYLSVVGYTIDKINIRLSNLMAFHATAQGNWGCLSKYYPDVLKLVLSGKVKISPFVQLRPLSEINLVFNEVHKGRIKQRVILTPDN